MNILIAYWILSGIIYALMLFKTIDDVITGDDEWLFAITIGGIATPVVIIKKLING